MTRKLVSRNNLVRFLAGMLGTITVTPDRHGARNFAPKRFSANHAHGRRRK
jgi:hypothetical protein